MKPQRASLSLLFLFVSYLSAAGAVAAAADSSVAEAVDSVHQLYKRVPQIADADVIIPKAAATATTTTAAAAATSTSSRKAAGTKDAPVDGHDGKPHEGPFVDSADSSKDAGVLGLILPEDGVMNDQNRAPPKQGTTGTEGGVSEKSKELDWVEDQFGKKMKQVPQSPKDADAVSHTEEDQLAAEKGGKAASAKQKVADDSTASTTKDTKKPEKADKADKEKAAKEKAKGAMSLERPDDLPSKPHDIPIPNPLAHSQDKTIESDKFTSSKSKEADSDDEYKAGEDKEEEEEEEEGVHDVVRWDSLIGSLSSIIATEIGDKTFIVAALMAMRHPRIQVFTAAFSALFVMTILSGFAGHAVGHIISKRWAAVMAAGLFLVFGAKSLKEGFEMDPHQGVSEEIREVEAELEEKEVDMARANGHQRISPLSPDVLESGRVERSRSRSRMSIAKRRLSASRSPSPSLAAPTIQDRLTGIKNLLALLLSPAWVETFSMTFVGELGDRSQIATVAMAAGQEYLWVMIGATIGHFLCTAGAVIGGSMLAGRVSMRKVTLAGGFIFIGFGLFTLLEAVQYWH